MKNDYKFYFFTVIISILLFPGLNLSASDSVKTNEKIIRFNTNDVRVRNLGKPVNQSGMDYSSAFSPDEKTIYFVSCRKGGILTENGDISHDVWFSKRRSFDDTSFSEPKLLYSRDCLEWQKVNTSLNEGALTISPDGKSIFFTGCNRRDGLGGCDIYFADLDDDMASCAKNFSSINSKYWESQPSLSPDKTKLFFCRTKSLNENNIICLSTYNTTTNKMEISEIHFDGYKNDNNSTPFICYDNKTLIFASQTLRPNYGGKDLFISRYDEKTNTWSSPENLGSKINSKKDDFFPFLSRDGKRLYFSSNRTDIAGYQGDLDIYEAILPEPLIETEVEH